MSVIICAGMPKHGTKRLKVNSINHQVYNF